MSKVNLAISGCMGRMGQQLVKSSRVNKNFNRKFLLIVLRIINLFVNNKPNIIYIAARKN